MILETFNIITANIRSYYYDIINNLAILLNFDFKKFIAEFSYVYYVTIFFMLVRITGYFGIMLISLINTRHTTKLKTNSFRNILGIFVKLYPLGTFRKNLLKLITVIYL